MTTTMQKFMAAFLSEKKGNYHTSRGRLLYPTFLKPRAIKTVPDSKPKYSGSLLIPKAANLEVFFKGIEDAGRAEFGADWKKKVKRDRLPWQKTEDNPTFEEYADQFPVIIKGTAGVDFKPAIFGPNAQELTNPDPSAIYGGRWAVFAGKIKAYSEGSPGIGFYLNKVQLLEDDEPIGFQPDRSNDGFEAIELGGGGVMGGADWDPMQ